MGWAIETRSLAGIHSYADAQVHYLGHSPWKDSQSVPLAERRKKHMALAQIPGGYGCRLYDTHVVEYYEDCSLKLTTYDTRSTVDFAWCMRPLGWAPVSHHGNMYWRNDSSNQHYRGTIVVDAHGLVVSPGETITEQRLDTLASKEVHKTLRPFLTWLDVTRRLTDMKDVPFYHIETELEKLLRQPDNQELYPRMLRAASYMSRQDIYRLAYRKLGLYKARITENRALPRRAT